MSNSENDQGGQILSGSENDQDSTDSKTHNKKRSPIYDLTFACDKDGKKLENEDIASKYRNCNHCKKSKPWEMSKNGQISNIRKHFSQVHADIAKKKRNWKFF